MPSPRPSHGSPRPAIFKHHRSERGFSSLHSFGLAVTFEKCSTVVALVLLLFNCNHVGVPACALLEEPTDPIVFPQLLILYIKVKAESRIRLL